MDMTESSAHSASAEFEAANSTYNARVVCICKAPMAECIV
jgi:hypothetical protein